ncbi:peptidoglycan binding domain-containing protein [Streptomyces sp. NPDC057011]|uniref:peptidoglycan binding domain-containing protein n=1 Tax=unclassified Streptomyces TaxID=2593676 RepID=UPI00362B7E35
MTSKPSTPDADGPKTETTLTTRIRINIPGSRPIPPVVVRKAMGAGSDSAGAEPEAGPTAPQGPEPTPGAAYGGPGQASAPALAQRPKQPLPTRIQAEAEPAREQGGPAGAEGPASNWFAPRKAPAPAPTPPAASPAPGTGPGPGAGPAGPPAPVPGARVGAPQPPAGPGAGFPPPVHTPAPPVSDFSQGFAQAAAPAGPRPGVPGGPGVGATQGFPVYGAGQDDTGPVTEAFPVYGTPGDGTPAGPAGPAGPTGGPGYGAGPLGAPRPDEAPRWPGPEVPGPNALRPSVSDADRPEPAAPRPVPAQQKATSAKPVKKGRSKLVLLGGGLVALVAVAYGAGLLLNHSDVPKGTTVLDVDISGSRDEAVAKLQTAFGTRAAAPLQLSVGGKQVELKPEKAGLTLDSQTTVRNAAGSDYNPVTVIGSLLGNERRADAVMPVDEEKLQVALQELAGTAGTATEGTIKFDTGKPVAVPGTPGTTLDADASVEKVTQAFRDMVATGKSAVVELPVTTKSPAIDEAELNRAMKEFAEPAMSANAVVKVGSKSIAFGSKSLPKILSMQAVDGHLVEKFDLEALKETYGNTFDGITITRGTGAKTAVTPQDIAGALGKALRGKTTAERTVVVDTNAA